MPRKTYITVESVLYGYIQLGHTSDNTLIMITLVIDKFGIRLNFCTKASD